MSLHDELAADLPEMFSLDDFGRKAVYFANTGTKPDSLLGINFWRRSQFRVNADSNGAVTSWEGDIGSILSVDGSNPFPSYGKSLSTDSVKAVRFGGFTPMQSEFGNFTTSGAFTIFMVLRANALQTNGAFCGRSYGTGPFFDPSTSQYAIWLDTTPRLMLSVSVNGVTRADYNQTSGTFQNSDSVRLITVRFQTGGLAKIRVNGVEVASWSAVSGTLTNVGGTFDLSVLGLDPTDFTNTQSFDLFDLLGYSVALSDSNVIAVENFLLANSAGYQSSINIHFVNEFEAALLDPNNAEASRPFALCRTIDIPNASHDSDLMVDDFTYRVVGVQPYTSGITKLLLSKDAD